MNGNVPQRIERYEFVISGGNLDAFRYACEQMGVVFTAFLWRGRAFFGCRSDRDAREQLAEAGFRLLRFRHIVASVLPGERAAYYEAEVQFHGPYRADYIDAKQSLLDLDLWTLIKRQQLAFDVDRFVAIARLRGKHSTFLDYESYAVLEDTNPHLGG